MDKFPQVKIPINMKKLFIIIVGLQFRSGCASFKRSDESPIENFLRITSTKTDELIIIKEKLNTNHTIEIFKGTTPFKKDREPHMQMQTGVSNSLFKKDDFKLMMEKYYKESLMNIEWSVDEWMSSDFNFPIYMLLSRKNFSMLDSTNYIEDREIYAFSDIIRYGSDYYVFGYLRSYTLRQYFSSITVVVMQKQNGKWKIVEQANREFD